MHSVRSSGHGVAERLWCMVWLQQHSSTPFLYSSTSGSCDGEVKYNFTVQMEAKDS